VQTPELRPAVILDHAEDVSISELAVEGNAGAESALRFIDAKQVLMTAPRLLKQGKIFLQVEGSGTSGIIVDGGDLTKAADPVVFKNAAEKGAVKLR
jgi:hypothetical protein